MHTSSYILFFKYFPYIILLFSQLSQKLSSNILFIVSDFPLSQMISFANSTLHIKRQCPMVHHSNHYEHCLFIPFVGARENQMVMLVFPFAHYTFSVTLSRVRARARDASLCLYSFRLSFCLSLSSALIVASLALTLSISSGFSAESTIRTTRLFTI